MKAGQTEAAGTKTCTFTVMLVTSSATYARTFTDCSVTDIHINTSNKR